MTWMLTQASVGGRNGSGAAFPSLVYVPWIEQIVGAVGGLLQGGVPAGALWPVSYR